MFMVTIPKAKKNAPIGVYGAFFFGLGLAIMRADK